MRSFARPILASAIAAALASPAIVQAQTADATLRGSAPANAEVTAKNVATGATRRTKANAQGSYTLAGLTPGTYRVDAGPGTEQVVTVTVASTATLDLVAGGQGGERHGRLVGIEPRPAGRDNGGRPDHDQGPVGHP